MPTSIWTLFRDLLYAYRVYLVMAKNSEPFNLLERLRSTDSEPFPYPGTNAARRHGCLCPDARPAQGTMEDPWYWMCIAHCTARARTKNIKRDPGTSGPPFTD